MPIDQQLTHLREVARQVAVIPAGNTERSRMEADFDQRLRAIVRTIAKRDGVAACFAVRDGHVVQSAGGMLDYDALGDGCWTLVQTCATLAEQLGLGTPQQELLLGDVRKLAIIRVGPVMLGIVAGAKTSLHAALYG